MKILKFNNINWELCENKIAKLQEKLTAAYISYLEDPNNKEKKEKVIKIQQIIVLSFWGRSLAVKKVVSNRGKITPGIDKEIWSTDKERSNAIIKLAELIKGKYKAKPLKRINIPKKDGNSRPISIPCMIDRAMQALYALALDPISEVMSDVRSYGYRKNKGCQDAICYMYKIISVRNAAKYVLEGDIKNCFNNITHKWILENIPMDKKILKEFLKAGYIGFDKLNPIDSGIPQGSIISPIIANMTLNGIEKLLIPLNKYKPSKEVNPKIHLVRYADNFVISGDNINLLKNKVLPIVTKHLSERGLSLNQEKTKITEIKDGFDFLGVTYKSFPTKKNKIGEIVLMTPSKKSIKRFKNKVKLILRKAPNPEFIIKYLNPLIRGWANYYRFTFAKDTFTSLDHFIWSALMNWAKKKNKGVGIRALTAKYFRTIKGRKWIFCGTTQSGYTMELLLMAKIAVSRYLLCLDKNPYLSINKEYYLARISKEIKKYFGKTVAILISRQKGLCPVCNQPINISDEIEVHHIVPKKKKGSNNINNLLALHSICHKHITYTSDPIERAKYEKLGIIKYD